MISIIVSVVGVFAAAITWPENSNIPLFWQRVIDFGILFAAIHLSLA